MPAQGRDRGSERRPEPSKGASRNLRSPLNRPSRGETTRFRAFRSQTARGSARRDRRTGFTLPLSLGESAFHRPVPARYARRAGAVERPLSPRCRPTHARHPAHPATPLPLAPLPRNRHRPRTRSVATPRSHLDCRNVLILIVAGQSTGSFARWMRARAAAGVVVSVALVSMWRWRGVSSSSGFSANPKRYWYLVWISSSPSSPDSPV